MQRPWFQGARAIRIQNYVDVVITSRPRIAKQLTSSMFELRCRVVAQKVQGFAQRLAPRLVPSRLAASVTTTISRPAPNAVHATPRATFTIRSIIDLNDCLRRMTIEILCVVRDPKTG